MLRRARMAMVAAVVAVAGWSSLAPAQSEEPAKAPASAPAGSTSSRSGHFAVGGCLGFTMSPDQFAGQAGERRRRPCEPAESLPARTQQDQPRRPRF